MKCHEIKEVIITDYVDGQLPKEETEQVEFHLKNCADCREYAASVRDQVVLPFAEFSNVKLDRDRIWQKLQDSIEKEREQGSRFYENIAGFFQDILVYFMVPRRAVVLVTLAIVLIVTVSVNRLMTVYPAKTNVADDPIEYYASLDNSWDEFDVTYKTDVEQFLL